MGTPTMYFNIAANGEPLGRVSFELFAKFQRAENFRALSTGERDLVIKVPAFTELFRDLRARAVTSQAIMAQVASPSMGRNFPETYRPWHLVMANAGPNTNGSQFFMCTAKTEWLDGKHVVFGRVKEGMAIVTAMGRFGSRNGKTSKKITIADCGQL